LLGITLVAVNAFGFSSRQVLSNSNKTEINMPTKTFENVPPPKTVVHYCPAISELIKENLIWSARNGIWKSFSQSFATEIDHFLGAQWIGINVGKIICLYQGKGSFDFPIALEPEKTISILEPKSETWRSERNGYRMCRSTNVKDCPFYTKAVEEETDVYETIKYQGQPGEINKDS
jgi:hypothetical protein